jgi:predicted nucleic acid-binding protein
VSRTLLLDTSVAVAYLVADHAQHEVVTDRVEGAELGLAGHTAFEVYSVLTRLPPLCDVLPPLLSVEAELLTPSSEAGQA